MSNEVFADHYALVLNRAPFEWSVDEGRLRFFGIPSALLWLNPSLLKILRPLADEIGIPLFRLLVAHSGSFGTAEDYHDVVKALGATFEEGLLAWGEVISTIGWGRLELPFCDMQQRRAIVRIRNPWELDMQRGQAVNWGCPFLQGKIIGLFTHAFGVPCWADEKNMVTDGDETSVEFHVYESNRTIESEIAILREARERERQQRLLDEIAAKTLELQKANEERLQLQEQIIAMQARTLAELSTPLIPLNKRVLLMPLIGAFDSQRTQLTVDRLLHGVAEYHASVVILDITGVPIVDTHVASALMQAAQAVRLLGAEVVLTGIRPEVAQTLVGMGVSLQGIVTRGTLQSGIEYANSTQ